MLNPTVHTDIKTIIQTAGDKAIRAVDTERIQMYWQYPDFQYNRHKAEFHFSLNTQHHPVEARNGKSISNSVWVSS